MYGEYCNTWDYHREFNIVHFGNPGVKQPEPEPTPEPEVEPAKRKLLFVKKPKGWFRR